MHHDLFIVQVVANVIDKISDPELQLFLSRQLGNDGAHAENTRRRVEALFGHDPIEDIQKQVQKHWDFMGDIPRRGWLGFLAFELHYEHHIVAIGSLNRRLSRLYDPQSSSFSLLSSGDTSIMRETKPGFTNKARSPVSG